MSESTYTRYNPCMSCIRIQQHVVEEEEHRHAMPVDSKYETVITGHTGNGNNSMYLYNVY